MQLIALNVLTIVMDVLWCLTMRSVWKNKPAKNAKGQKGFNLIRSTTLYLSVANILIKVRKKRCIMCVVLIRESQSDS
jgi:hypothetical protein